MACSVAQAPSDSSTEFVSLPMMLSEKVLAGMVSAVEVLVHRFYPKPNYPVYSNLFTGCNRSRPASRRRARAQRGAAPAAGRLPAASEAA
jgi:hypothetical protein